MPALDDNAIAALLISALLLSLLWARRRGSAPRKPPAESLDTLQAWTPQAVRVLTLPERKAYDLLRKALPGRLVLAQVPLARFISVPTRHSYSEWLTRVGRLSVDLLVCDHSSRVIAAIDVRTDGESPRSHQRHVRMAEVLQAAGIRVVHWRADALPSASEVRSLFMVSAEEAAAVAAAASAPALGPGGKALLPVPEMMELLAAGDEAAAASPQFDPVSSGFFDDLDAMSPGHSSRA